MIRIERGKKRLSGGRKKGRGREPMVWCSLKEHNAHRPCVWPRAVEEFGLWRKELSLLKGLPRLHCPSFRAEVNF